MAKKVQPTVGMVEYAGERIAENQSFVHEVSIANVRNTMEKFRTDSPILKEMEDNGEIKIIGALYDMEDGSVDFLDY